MNRDERQTSCAYNSPGNRLVPVDVLPLAQVRSLQLSHRGAKPLPAELACRPFLHSTGFASRKHCRPYKRFSEMASAAEMGLRLPVVRDTLCSFSASVSPQSREGKEGESRL
ncbi:hypothetical protein HPB50_018543 [Hyalomma asiaticum]|uniref:Uncharacterized protein n=1 Tax=Hyalomma asiaticum TaxID=266040 RepID=A0ACB7TMK6_HYAAI|nr:hypothetical protein HPB50_018543 [Hyalomma asiaticum]